MPGRDHRERGVLRRRDRLERVHDAEHRAEQADERAGRGDGRQHQQIRFEPLDLARDRHVEHLVDARVQAAERARPPAGTSASTRASRRRTAPPRRCSAGSTARCRAPRATGRTRTPARNSPSRCGTCWNRRVLSKMIVQHHREARKRPSITALTTMWADQNIERMLVSGVAAAAATSAGFMGVMETFLTSWPRCGRRRNLEWRRGLPSKSAETWAASGGAMARLCRDALRPQ